MRRGPIKRRVEGIADGCCAVVCALGLAACAGEGETAYPAPHQDGGADAQADATTLITCQTLGIDCGESPDGHGGKLNCGTCPAGQLCGGGGANRCGDKPVTPETCQSLGVSCGSVWDKVSKFLDCGTCTAPLTCGGGGTPNVCGCTPATCTSLGANCGSVSNGCTDAPLDCGACTAPLTCGGGGTPNVCGCTPATCASLGKSCGSVPDGCGGTVGCGGCSDGVSDGTCIDNVCVHSCGNEPGYGNCDSIPNGGNGTTDCDPSNNVGGCVSWWFDGWCRRRYEDGHWWKDVMGQWATTRCDTQQVQKVVPQDPQTQETLYYCISSTFQRYECYTPLVLVFEGERLAFEPSSGPSFDVALLRGPYHVDRPTVAWLAMDRNSDGTINDGSELFGSATRLRDGREAIDGFEALQELDSNGDGVISDEDPGFHGLVLFSESSPHALVSLAARGVQEIDLRYEVRPDCDERGNCVVERAAFRYKVNANERVGEVADVHLNVRKLGRSF